MIERSTDIGAALRSRQKGFLLNPFRFHASGGPAFNPDTGVTSGTLKLWIDPSDNAYVAKTVDGTYGNIFTSATCKKSGTVFSNITPSASPTVNTSVFPLQSMHFGVGGTHWLTNATGVTINNANFTAFVALYWDNRNSQYSSLSLYHGTASNAIQTTAGMPYVIMYTASNSSANPEVQSSAAYAYSTTGLAKGSRGLFEFYPKNPLNTSVILLNNTSLTLTSSGTQIAMPYVIGTIGSTDTLYQANGAFGEILVYEGTVNSTDAANVRSYLKTKWGTP